MAGRSMLLVGVGTSVSLPAASRTCTSPLAGRRMCTALSGTRAGLDNSISKPPLILEQVVGLADAFAELARVGEMGVCQARLQPVVLTQRHIERGGDGDQDQQAHHGFTDFFPTHLEVP
ncbi:hypothetical protein WR25_16554 [Diploscapter pachys]|uniref:Uncharacterized protein n=1 Tax=Diploscapter pachys TaxID=2018661 RepID=A0A2A2M3A0_9BILA|nr:hypothetical protein WR25_16554 [Diploscapter pachys]